MTFYAIAGVWGLGEGALIGDLLGALDGLCDVKHLALLLGLELFSEGTGSLGGGPLCGKDINICCS